MEKQVFENSFSDFKRFEPKKQKPHLAINILGGFSLAFSLLSLFLILAMILAESEDKLMQIGLIFSALVFSLIGMICGTIGFLKAKIIKKGGHYATTGFVLNIFGFAINAFEIIGLIALTISDIIFTKIH